VERTRAAAGAGALSAVSAHGLRVDRVGVVERQVEGGLAFTLRESDGVSDDEDEGDEEGDEAHFGDGSGFESANSIFPHGGTGEGGTGEGGKRETGSRA